MDLNKLASQAGSFLKSDTGKKLVSGAMKAASGKAGSKSSGLDLTSLIGLASKNADMINVLGAIGGMKGTADFDATSTLKLVSQLKKLVTENIGKIDNNTFKTIVNKLLSSSTVKAKVEKIAGAGTSAFIKKAITAFVEK